MLKKLLLFSFKNLKLLGLILIIIFTIFISTYSNHQKKISINEYNNFIDNIYLKKTLIEIVNNLEPRYKNIITKLNLEKLLTKYLTNTL